MYIEKLIEPEIASNSYNMFLYGRNNPQREERLKSIADNHPFVFREDKACVIYLDEFGLPVIAAENVDINDDIIDTLSSRYLDFCIVEAVLEKLQASKNITKKDGQNLIDYFYFPVEGRPETLEELIQNIKESKSVYKNGYHEYCMTGDADKLYSLVKELDIQFILSLSDFLEVIQHITENREPFMIILDRKKKISFSSVQSINSLIRMRHIRGLCIKVACECDEWETISDHYGNYIDGIHDYLTVELDDSYQKYLDTFQRHNCQNE